MTARMVKHKVVAAFDGWVHATQKRRRDRVVVRRAVAKLTRNLLANSFVAWYEAGSLRRGTEEEEARRWRESILKCERYVYRMSRRTLSRAFTRWETERSRMRVQRRALRNCVARMSRRALFAAFSSWWSITLERRRHRALVGGAVAGHAGTRDGETVEHLVSLTVVEQDGRVGVRGRDQMAPRYRDGGLGRAVVVQATFELVEDHPKRIFDRFSASLQQRNQSQPVTQRSVGCVFQNPEGDAAGRLIQEAGCKDLRRNGVQVSAKHANYFVNDDTGTAADFLALMADVRERVLDQFGVELQPEVKFWGFDRT